MKKVTAIVLSLILCLSSFGMAIASEDNIGIMIYGKEVTFDRMPVNVNGRVLVPLRGIFETLGAKVNWDDATKTVTAERNGTNVKLTIDSKTAYVNDKEIALDVPASIMDSRTLVPVRFVSEALGEKVDWIDSTKTVVVVSKDREIKSDVHRAIPTTFKTSSDYKDMNDYNATGITVPEEMRKTPVITPQDVLNASYTFEKGGKVEKDGDVIRVTVDGVTNNTTCAIARLNGFLKDKYEAKDRFIISFSARLISDGKSGRGSVQVQQEHPETYKKSVFQLFDFGSEWENFIFPYETAADAIDFAIRFGFSKQTIEIKDFYVYNVKKEFTLSELPNTASDFSYWFDNKDWKSDTSWQADMLKTIDKVRKGDFKVVVKDKDGNPIKDAKIEANMFEHGIDLGVNVKSADLTDENKTQIAKYFNAAIVKDGMEWTSYDASKVNSQIDTLKNLGIKKIIASPVIKDAQDFIPSSLYDARKDKTAVNTAVKERIETVLKDVNADEFILTDDLLMSTAIRNKLGNSPLIDWYSYAEALGKKVMVNQNYLASRPSYNQYINYLLTNGAKVDSIGIGMEINAETLVDAKRTVHMYDNLKEFNKDIVVTNLICSSVDGDTVSAGFLRYSICSALMNPFVEGIYLETIPGAYAEEEFIDLMYNKFWTKGVSVNTDAEGNAVFNGFFGDYDIKVTANGKEIKVSKAFSKGCENVLEIVVE